MSSSNLYETIDMLYRISLHSSRDILSEALGEPSMVSVRINKDVLLLPQGFYIARMHSQMVCRAQYYLAVQDGRCLGLEVWGGHRHPGLWNYRHGI